MKERLYEVRIKKMWKSLAVSEKIRTFVSRKLKTEGCD